MKYKKVKLMLFVFFLISILFFSNDFGLIDIERTAIITALAIDLEDNGEYTVTAQIAVPEATDQNTESKRAQISGTGGTVAGAIKKIGDLSGWYPNMNFCNIIIIGNELASTNVMKVLDYFSRTFRLQDSALIAMTDKKAKDVLIASTPFDNISSFALQKIIIKNTGFENDVITMDIKNFCTGYYSSNSSSYMPVIKILEQKQESSYSTKNSAQSKQSGKNGEEQGSNLFLANTTALFKNGVKVGELDSGQSFVFNTLIRNMKGALFELKGITNNESGNNVLLNVYRNKRKISLDATENEIIYKIDLELYCRMSDRNSENYEQILSSNVPLQEDAKKKAEEFFTSKINELIETEIQTECDFLNIKKTLYRKHFKYYSTLKDNFLTLLKPKISVTVNGQQ